MKRLINWVILPLATLGALLVVGVGSVTGWATILGPRVRPTSSKPFARTPERLERGEYLVRVQNDCMHCHTPLDPSKPGVPPREDMLGAGQEFPEMDGVKVYVPNITSDKETGIGSWTDDEIARAIREGVDKDGNALFPLMPYELFRNLSDEDVASIVVYLRTLRPIRNPLPKTDPGFPVRYLMRNAPMPLTKPVVYNFKNSVERGRHLSKVAVCTACHTPTDERHQPIPGLEFAGGTVMKEFPTPAVTANLTPDASGIGGFTREQFRRTLRTGNNGARQLHPIMPYAIYSKMTDEDVDALYDYLRSLKPVKHWVSSTGKPALCPVCNHEHPMAEMNISMSR